ncbi:MAG: hypothetical protein JSV03_11500, partial [Planctomycetota bacterium]
MSRYHFQYLLVVLILLLLAMPFVHFLRSEAYPILVPIVVTIIFSGMLITAVFTVSENRRSAMIAATLAVPSIFLQGLNLLLEQDGILIAHYLLSMTFLAYTIIIIIRFLFTDQRVTSNTIYASLCVYLLLGVLWSIGYSLIDILQPGSFTFASTESELIRSMRFGARQSLYPL